MYKDQLMFLINNINTYVNNIKLNSYNIMSYHNMLTNYNLMFSVVHVCGKVSMCKLFQQARDSF